MNGMPVGRRTTLVAPFPGVASAPILGGGGAPVVGGGGHAGSLPWATLLATAVFPMPDTVRSMSASCGVAAAVTHEQKLELAERLLKLDERESVERVSLSTPPRLAARIIDSSRCPCCEALRQVRSIDLASESNRIEALVSLVSRTQLRCDSHLGNLI